MPTLTKRQRRRIEIGMRVRQLREQRKMRQVDLAASASLSWRHLIRIEKGEGGDPRSETLDRIAESLGVKRTELTGEDDEEESELPSRLEILEALRPLGRLFANESDRSGIA